MSIEACALFTTLMAVQLLEVVHTVMLTPLSLICTRPERSMLKVMATHPGWHPKVKAIHQGRCLVYNPVLPKLTARYMTTETSVIAIVFSLTKAHVLKATHHAIFYRVTLTWSESISIVDLVLFHLLPLLLLLL